MTIERAIEILTPDKTRYTPKEYAEALELARDSIKKMRDIENIVNSQQYIQEDVLKYKMVCEALKNGRM